MKNGSWCMITFRAASTATAVLGKQVSVTDDDGARCPLNVQPLKISTELAKPTTGALRHGGAPTPFSHALVYILFIHGFIRARVYTVCPIRARERERERRAILHIGRTGRAWE